MRKEFLNWRQVIPTLFTLVAMLAGFLSIVFTVKGMQVAVGPYDINYRWAAKMIMLAMILDGLDGNIARWLKGESEFGAELDTYVDMTAFGIAPAVLIFAVTLQSPENHIWRLVLPSAVALSGVVRLARFKVQDTLRGQGGYAGLPITGNAGWVALFVFISQVAPREGTGVDDVLSLRHGWFAAMFLVGVIVFISLQVTNVRYPKPTKSVWLFVPCIIFVLLMVLLPQHQALHVSIVMLGIGLVYAIIGPLFVKGVAVHKARRLANEGCSGEDD